MYRFKYLEKILLGCACVGGPLLTTTQVLDFCPSVAGGCSQQNRYTRQTQRRAMSYLMVIVLYPLIQGFTACLVLLLQIITLSRHA